LNSLKEKLIKGTFWNSIAQAGTFGINFVLTFVLARLLEPDDFGLLGMIMVITGFLGYFSECGIIAAIIRKVDKNELYLNTAFWSGIVFSLIVYLFLYLFSPLIALFFKEPRLVLLTRVMSLMFVLGAYSFVPIALEMKDLRYRAISFINLASVFFSGIAAFTMAILGFEVWALVCQQILQRLIISLCCFLFLSWRPRLQFNKNCFRDIFSFGFHVTGNNLIKFFSENIDYLLVGKLLGPSALGFYTMAFRLSRFPIEKMQSIFGTMLFPTFASIQDNMERLQQNYIKISVYGGLLLIPFILGLAVFINPIISYVIGEKWLPSAGLIQIFCIYISFYCFSFADEPLLMLRNIRILNIMKLLYSVLILGIGYSSFKIFNLDLFGMAWVYTFCFVAMYINLKAITWRTYQINVSMHQEIITWKKLKKDLSFNTFMV